MSAFQTVEAGLLRADPAKRVNYSFGLVLGVDEFQQEQLYHLEGRRLHSRALHGYGTVWGLAVAPPEPGDAEPELRVSAGLAVDRRGREIQVPATMCVRLNAWVDRYRAALEALLGPAPVRLPLAVVLCHRECPDDVVPVPGEPCRTQDDAMQPSRIRDAFELRLALRADDVPALSPPDTPPGAPMLYTPVQPEEEAARAFGELLARVRTTGEAVDDGAGARRLMEGVLALADPAPPVASPPDDAPILLGTAAAGEVLREAFRLWVTRVRPILRGREAPDACADVGCCLLLAEVDVPVDAAWLTRSDAVDVDERRRPVLLHTRLLQEWLARGGGGAEAVTLARVEALSPRMLRVWLRHATPLTLPAEAVGVSINGRDFIQPTVRAAARVPNAFDVRFTTDMVDGSTVEVRLDTARIEERGSGRSLAEALQAAGRETVDLEGRELRVHTIYDRLDRFLGGDLSGRHPAPRLAAIQGQAISAERPEEGQVLTFVEGSWVPQAPPATADPGPAAGDLRGEWPDLTIAALQGVRVEAERPEPGDVLVFDGQRWTPRAAARPPEEGQRLVAAGWFDGDGRPLGPVHNGTRVRVSVERERLDVVVVFEGYEPDRRFAYLPRVTFQHEAAGEARLLRFAGQDREGLTMMLTGELPRQLRGVALMVEINRIG